MGTALRAAVVGTAWGLVHVHALRRHGVEVVALAGQDPATVRRIATEEHITHAVTNLAELHGLALDLVCIATPPHTHAAVAAALAPLPMLCEKPLLGPGGTAQQLGAFSPHCWVNYAFPYLDVARAAARLLPSLGAVQRVVIETTHELGRVFEPRAALAELASHPWAFVAHQFGLPREARGFVDVDGGAHLALLHGDVRTNLQCCPAPGLAGLRHRVAIQTQRGRLEIDGRFRQGEPWRFVPLRLDGEELAAEAPADPAADPWITANVAAIGDVVAVLRGELDEATARERGLCDLERAFALDDTITHTLLPRLTLRDAHGGDLDLTYSITRDAMQRYVEQTWGRWDEAEQQAKHRDNFDPASLRIVQLDGEPVGLIVVEHHADHHWLVKLYLLERARGFGLGAHLLRQTIARADAARLPLRLRVLRVNTRAQALYRRHGFHVTGETAERLFMQREPAA